MELPLVTTTAAGCRDTVVDGLTGLLAPPRDSGALAVALRALLEDAHLRRSLGAAGRRRAVQRFDVRRTVADIEALSRDVAAGVSREQRRAIRWEAGG